MTLATGVVAFVIMWWLVLFTVLPWGVKRNLNPAVGEDPGAPMRARIILKVAVTTGITLLLWGALFAAIEYEVFSFREISGGYQQ